jgi:signal recognition particle receptor subunit beta
MVQFNFSERTIKAKVVYYGPPQSGKTTNLEQIHRISDPKGTNRLISLNTAQDRTLFFDLLPFSLGNVSGYDFKIQLYTVPGQVQYNATRRVVLAGADAVVFVADSQRSMARDNLAAFENMKVNLLANRLVPEKVPLVLQYNKQDLDPLIPRPELDKALNLWSRKAFPAVASRGDGVMETFAAVVQEMLASIAVKYNLKEKGLDPQAVPEIVAQAFTALVRPPPAGAAARPASPPLAPARVVIAQPEGVEPAYPGQVGPEVSPVSEELLHRAIRSNVELAEALGELIRAFGRGLDTIHAQAEHLAAPGEDASRAARVAAIEREVQRLRDELRQIGAVAGAARAGPPGRAPAPPQAAPTPPRGTGAPAVPGPAPPPVAPPPAPAPPVRAPLATATLDGVAAEAVGAAHAALAAHEVTVESRIGRGAALPRCSPDGLRRAVAGLVQGLAATVPAATAIQMRAERKPVLLRGRDGREVRREFLMLALTHAGGLREEQQQKLLAGKEPGPLGEAHRLVREMGGFLRFAPLPGGSLETRVFPPA